MIRVLVAGITAALTLVTASSATGQTPTLPSLALVEDFRLSPRDLGFVSPAPPSILPGGLIIATGDGKPEVRILSQLGKVTATVRWDAENFSPGKVFFIGDTILFREAKLSGGMTAEFTSRGKLVSVFPTVSTQPAIVGPELPGAITFPLFTPLPGGMYLGRALIRATGTLGERTFYLTGRAGGPLDHVIARTPDRRCVVRGADGASHTMPGCAEPLNDNPVARDGRVVFVVTDSSAPVASAFTVTVLSTSGDTLLNRRYPATGTMTSGKDDTSQHSTRVVEARGTARGTVLLRLQSPGRTGFSTWLLLDSNGDPVGAFELPSRVLLLEADSEHIWTFGPEDGVLLRYRITK